MLGTEHSPGIVRQQSSLSGYQTIDVVFLLEILNPLINLLHCVYEHFLMQMITPVAVKLPIGTGTWPFSFLPVGCDMGN